MPNKNYIPDCDSSINIDLATLWYPTLVDCHDSYEFYYLINGHTSYIINNTRHEIHENDIVWLPPHITHSVQVDENRHHKRLLLLIPPHFLDEIFEQEDEFRNFFSIPRIIHMSENERKKISRYCNLILEEDWSKDKFYSNSIRSLLSLLIIQTFRLVKNNTEVISNTSKPNETLTTILRYIDKRYDVNITLPRLATQVHMTPNYISHLFRKHLDTTLTSYLLNIRISKARDFLINTNLTITDISQKCGFNSLNHFCKSFKKIMGVSPTAFREICK